MSANHQKLQAQERLAGIVLMVAALAALVAANSPLAGAYDSLLHTKFGPAMPRFGKFDLAHWVADGAMAVFFLLIGLEVKREWYRGRLSQAADRRLPILAAIGGMLVPALVYAFADWGDAAHLRGWAIPAATDIAFAIGVLAILGRHAPSSIKLLLVSIAVVDDVGAVAIIALVYTASIDIVALTAALGVLAGMAVMNMLGVRRLWPYLIAALVLWFLVLASGVHSTIAGVLAALAIPLGASKDDSPLRDLEHAIHPWVMFGVVPLFGFTSAGVALGGGLEMLRQPVALGVMLGLFIGKQVGVFGAIWAAIRLRLVPMPAGANWRHLWGAAALCGIGFTMSLFIGALAFPDDKAAVEAAKLGTLAGSLLSAGVGYALLRFTPEAERDDEEDEADDVFAGTARTKNA